MTREKIINIAAIFFAAAATYTLRASTQPVAHEIKQPPTLNWRPAAAKLEQATQRLAALDGEDNREIETGALRWTLAENQPASAAKALPPVPAAKQGLRQAYVSNLSNTSASPAYGETDDFQARMDRYATDVERAATQGKEPPARWNYLRVADLIPIGRIELGGKTRLLAEIRDEQSTSAIAIGTSLSDAQLVDVTRTTAVFRLANGELRTVRFTKQKAQLRRIDDQTNATNNSTNPSTKEVSKNYSPQPNESRASDSSGADNQDSSPAAKRNDTKNTNNTKTIESRLTQPTQPQSVQPTLSTGQAQTLNHVPSEPISVCHGCTAGPRKRAENHATDDLFSDEWGNNGTFPKDRKNRLNGTVFLTPLASGNGLGDVLEIASAKTIALGWRVPIKRESRALHATQSPTPGAKIDAASESAITEEPHGTAAEIGKAPTTFDTNLDADAETGKSSGTRKTLCDPTAHGEPLTIDGLTRPIAFQTLVEQLNQTFGANIVLEPEIQDLPVRVSVRDLPWMDLIRTIAEWNDLTIDCDANMVRIMRRARRQQIDQARRQQEPLVRKVFKLKYVQPSQSVRVNLAGQPADGGGGTAPTVASLEEAIRAILRAGDGRGDVRRVPGRNELIVAATAEQLKEIEELIGRVDRPTYQVVIRTLVYTVNENRLRDVGLQIDGIITGRSGRTVGGFATQNSTNATGMGNTSNPTGSTANNSVTTGSSGQQQVSLTPGGIPNLGPFNRVTSPLGAAQPNSIAFFSSIIGTAQLDAALTLAQQRGAARVESRPFCVVAEGETCNTVNGTTIPVVTTAIAGGATVGVGQPSFIEASRVLAVTPQVAEDEAGRPAFVTLNVRLENNTVDTSLPLFNGLPGINRQSLQTILRLRPGETAVIGGLTNDQFSRALAQVPGLGRIPGIGRLFQRRFSQTTTNRLYFAITAEVVTQNQSLPGAPANLSTELPPTPTVK